MDKEEIEKMAFTIIAHAGDATDFCYQALEHAKKGEFETSSECMKKSNDAIILAHKAQMALITDEANGVELPYGVLISHAQDHLMNAMSSKKLVQEIIELYKVAKGVKK